MLSGLFLCWEGSTHYTPTHTREGVRVAAGCGSLALALMRANAEVLHMRGCNGLNIKRTAMLKHFKQILFWLAWWGRRWITTAGGTSQRGIKPSFHPWTLVALILRDHRRLRGAGKWFNGLMQASLQTTSFFCFHNQHVFSTRGAHGEVYGGKMIRFLFIYKILWSVGHATLHTSLTEWTWRPPRPFRRTTLPVEEMLSILHASKHVRGRGSFFSHIII